MPNQTITSYLPQILQPYLMPDTEEIRFRRNRKVMLLSSQKELITPVIADNIFMEELMDTLTKSSLYTYFDEISSGYLTLEGGHRAGISGTAVYQNGKLSNVRDISSVNVRIAREVKGCADEIFRQIQLRKTLPGILLISPPGCGKTTLLRDLTRQVSDFRQGVKIAVIDERNELGSVYRGAPQNDLGQRTDILNGYTKPDGICRAIRSLSPSLIVVDEIGSPQDEESLLSATYAGVKVFATIHGDRRGEFKKNILKLTREHIFDYYIYLSNQNPTNRIQAIEAVTEEPL